ncbi:MAG: hypothetical protein JRE18_06055 [Deltaproteobacteria bacterium]|jgi:hypothetical protein|nr:hypothetical protein [Deltaproteobacteria bacterium]
MILKHWSFQIGDNEPSAKDELTVDIYVNPITAVLKTIYSMLTSDLATRPTCKAEMKLNNERLDFKKIKIMKKNESFHLKGKGILYDMQEVQVTTTIEYTKNMNYMENEEFKCEIEVEKLAVK